jgi:pimeloyl-ACP methyl ester carboxylesterase
MKILFIHGLELLPSWWDRFARSFSSEGFITEILTMPEFLLGTQSWVDSVLSKYDDSSQTVLIGHSLGGAVALEAARKKTPSAVICLAIPIAIGKLKEPPIVSDSLPEEIKTAINHTDIFLKEAVANTPPVCPVLYFWGTNDPYIEEGAVNLLPFPAISIPGAGHDLNREKRYISKITLASKQFLEENNLL